MQLSTKTKRIILIVFLVIAAAMAVLRMNVISSSLVSDPTVDNPEYILADTLGGSLFAAAVVVVAVLFVAFVILFGKGFSLSTSTPEPIVVFTSALTGFLSLGVVFYTLFMGGEISDITNVNTGLLILYLLTAVYFLCVTFSFKIESRLLLRLFSMVPIILFVVRIITEFIRQSTVIHTSSGNYEMMFLAAMLLFFVKDGKNTAASGSARTNMIFGYLAVLMTLIFVVPEIILSGFWFFHDMSSLPYHAIDLSFALYACSRIYSIRLESEDEGLSPSPAEAKKAKQS